MLLESVFVLNNGEISGNSTTSEGGGVYCGTTTINGGLITGNTAGSGGGIRCGTTTMIGGLITGNTASNGGGVTNGGTFTMTGGEISENLATNHGGGINGGTLKISGDAKIIHNQSKNHGGAARCILQMTGGIISGNSAINGGGVSLISGNSVISGGVLTENTASSNGGGICKEGDNQTLQITDGAFVAENTASSSGGGLYLADGHVIMDGGELINNVANYGGGVYVGVSAQSFALSGGVVCDNAVRYANQGNDIGIGPRQNANTNASAITICKAEDMDDNGSYVSVCWFDETQKEEIADQIEFTDPARTTSYYYTFRYVSTEMAAAIGETEYPTVQDAVNALAGNPGGQTITLLKSSRESIVVPAAGSGETDETANTSIILDLAGYSLQGSDSSVITVEENAALVIRDSSEAKSGKIYGGVGQKRADRTDNYTFGGGLYVKGSVCLESGTIQNNTASYGSGVYVSGTGRFSMKGGAIRNNIYHGIYVNWNDGTGGSLYMNGGEITGHRDEGIIAEGGSEFVMEAGSISGNGRGVQIRTAVMTMKGGVIRGNKTNDGAGIYVQNTGVLNAQGGSIEENTATNRGGGIYLAGGKINLDGTVIKNNTAANYGGGIFQYSGTTTVSGGAITGNTATNINGGGIYQERGSLILTQGAVYGNNCTEPAQDILVDTNCKVSLIPAASMNTEEYDIWFDAAAEAEEAYITEGLEVNKTARRYQLTASKVPDVEEAVVRIGETEYSDMQDAVTAAAEGDIIYLLKDINAVNRVVIPAGKNISLDLNGYSVISETENLFFVYGNLTLQDEKTEDDYKTDSTGGMLTLSEDAKRGRAVWVSTGGSLTVKSGTISGFRGMSRGGVILGKFGTAITISGGTFENNQATYGGVLGVYDTDLTTGLNIVITGGVFKNNQALYGGAIGLHCNTAKSVMNIQIQNAEFTENTAQYGGAVLVNTQDSRNISHLLKIHNCMFRKNSATVGAGGAVYYMGATTSGSNHGFAEIEVTESEFIQNDTVSSGGGLYISSAKTVLLRDVTADQNSALNYAGICCTVNGAPGRKITVEGAQIVNNSAESTTGGAYFSGDTLIRDITVKDNTARGWGAWGGGLRLAGSSAVMEKGLISGNASYYAGGIYVESKDFTMKKEVVITENTGTNGACGGIALAGSGNYDVSGKIYKNTASEGGGIYKSGSCVATLNDVEIKENKATNHGGGVCTAGGTLIVSEQAQIIENTAGKGGGVSLTSNTAKVIVQNGLISQNKATGSYGGGIYLLYGYLDIQGGKITENTSGGNGGGIACYMDEWWYINGNRNHLKITGGEISGNVASGSGGGLYISAESDDNVVSGGVIRNNTAYSHGGGVYVASRRTDFDLLKGGQIYDNIAGRGQDVYADYHATWHLNKTDAYLSLIKASEMFTEEENRSAIGWFDEVTNRVIEDAIDYSPVLRAHALTLKYQTTNVVAKIGETEYTTVQAAVDAIESGTYDGAEQEAVPVIVMVAGARENVTIPGGTEMILNLNGHTLQGMTTAVTVYGNLTIRDEKTGEESGEGIGTITGDSYTTGGGIHVRAGGYVKLESGQISNCNASRAQTNSVSYGGGGVYVEYGTFEMAGGSINNCRGSYGSAVYVKNGSSMFKMTGGEITNNRAFISGSVSVHGGLFQMTGGKIYENTSGSSGAGVHVEAGRVLLYDGEITDNTAVNQGGGIYINTGTVRLKNTKIARNELTAALPSDVNSMTGCGGGIYMHNGYLYIYDGTEITENLSRRGGGIFQRSGTVQMIGGVITENTADRGGGVAQYPSYGSHFTLSKGQIYENTSSEIIYGNDIYSAYEGTGDYSTVKKENKPKMTLIPAHMMELEDYNVWKDDAYRGDKLEAELIDNGRYIIATIVESNNLQLTAAWHGKHEEEAYSTRMRVQSLKIEDTEGLDGVLDGTAEFDDEVIDKEVTAAEKLAAGLAVYSDETYLLNEDTPLRKISYDGDVYEQEQAVEWSAGDDSGAYNNIVRTYDSVIYTLTSTIGKMQEEAQALTVDELQNEGNAEETGSSLEQNAGGDGIAVILEDDDSQQESDPSDGDNQDPAGGSTESAGSGEDDFKEPDILRLWLRAELPCSAEEAEFASHGLDYYYMDEVERNGRITQVLSGYWEISNNGDGGTVEKKISVQIRGMKNGDTIKPVFYEWLEGNPEDEADPKVRSARILTISAAPRYNVTLQRNTQLAYTSYFDLSTGLEASKDDMKKYEAAVENGEPTDPNIVHGTMLGYGVVLSLYNDRKPERNSQNLKGMELPNGPISFDLTLSGSLYMNGKPITDEDGNPVSAIPTIWAYKENISTGYGSDIHNTTFNFQMDWNDEDDVTKTTQYGWDCAPFNSGGGNNACYNGGVWHAVSGKEDVNEEQDRVTMHFTVDGYSFDATNGPSQSANGGANYLFSPAQIKAFSAGYVQIIYPVDMKAVNEYQDRNRIQVGFVEINMEGMVSDLEAASITGQEPISTKTNGMDVMESYFGAEYLKHATDEMQYADNYAKDTSGLYNFRGGPGEADALEKTNYFNTEENKELTKERGTGSTPIGSDVYIGSRVLFTSNEFDTTDETDPHYNPHYDAQVDNRLEYNYMTAMNLLQKFDGDAYTPTAGTPAVVNQTYDVRAQSNSIAKGAFYINTSEDATTWSTYKTRSYTLTILYAAKPDGSNWTKVETNPDGTIWHGEPGTSLHDDGGTADMDRHTEENLIYFTTLQELYDYFGYDENGNPNGHCVAFLYQFRDCCIRTGRHLTVHSRMDVTNDFDMTGNTYATTNDVRCWSTYRPLYKEYYAAKKHTEIIQDFNWAYGEHAEIYASANGVTAYGLGSSDLATPAEEKVNAHQVEGYKSVELDPLAGGVGVIQMTQNYFNGYAKTQYEDGSKVNGTHNGWYSGNSLLLYTMQSSVFIENTDLVRGGNGARTEYNISNGDRTANFRISPKIQISSGVKDNELVLNGSQSTEVTITLDIPKHLYYTKGSVEFDYSAANCKYNQDELAWSVEETENEDGTTTLVFSTYVSDINKGLPEILYGCTIGTPDNPGTDILQGTTTLTSYVKIKTTYEEINRITCAAQEDQTSIRVIRDNNDYITKTVERNLVELGDDLVYNLSYSNYTETNTSIELVDILPYNGDGRKTEFHGGYHVKGLEITFFDQTSYDSFVDENGAGSLKVKKGFENPGNLSHTAQEAILDEGRNAAGGEDGWMIFTPQSITSVPDGGSVVYDLSEANICQYAVEDTGIAVFCKIPLIVGEKSVRIRLILSPLKYDDNELMTSSNAKQMGNDVYWNNFFYRNSEATPVVSGEVFVRTVDRTISGLAWLDQNQDGIYTIGTGAYVSDDRLLKYIDVSLYSGSRDALDLAVQEGKIAKTGENTWSPYKTNGSVDTSLVYSTVTIGGITYYPAVDVLGNLVPRKETDYTGSYSFTNLAAGNYFVVFSESQTSGNKYQVAQVANPGYWQYNHSIMPFSGLSVTPNRDTEVYTRPNLTTDKAMPNYNGVSDSAEAGPAPLDSAVITNGGGGIVLPELEDVQVGHYVTNRWNCGLYYIDLTLEKQWLNTRAVPTGSSVELCVTGTIGADTSGVTFNAVTYTLTQQSAANTVTVNTQGVAVPVNKPANAAVSGSGMTWNWTVKNQVMQAQGAGADGNGEEIVYHLSETAKNPDGTVMDGFVMETDEFTGQDLKKTFTAINTQILYDFRIAKTSSSAGADGSKKVLADAKYTLYTDEACTKQVSNSMTGVQTSGADGWFTFANMEAGTWYMKETKAPSGYQLSKAVYRIEVTYEEDTPLVPVITVTQIRDERTGESVDRKLTLTEVITDAEGSQTVVEYGKHTVSSRPQDVTESKVTTKYTISFSVEDECIYALPEAGGNGIWWNTVIGMTLMLGALLLMEKKKARLAA